ncbi:hypothetical protein GCM10010123_10430 [Pilimelia anulata]|uniref:Signal peptidase I n=1 Tax=Pilimelia anulata TaxID=53371 RepID=A0A8J3F7W0_9ACTN|nr:signal peptidase I [Pilimelia anulata]GGJ82695.1 hypothetical protein GCM10010123_10430 [Pilimelia anulata]
MSAPARHAAKGGPWRLLRGRRGAGETPEALPATDPAAIGAAPVDAVTATPEPDITDSYPRPVVDPAGAAAPVAPAAPAVPATPGVPVVPATVPVAAPAVAPGVPVTPAGAVPAAAPVGVSDVLAARAAAVAANPTGAATNPTRPVSEEPGTAPRPALAPAAALAAAGPLAAVVAPPAPAPQLTRVQRVWDHGVTALTLVRRLVLALAVGMIAWSLAPVAFGWQTSVVISGSMSPAIRVGDVVATSPVAKDRVGDIPKGTVILMDDPAQPGKLLLHRLVKHRKDGTLVTKGDANKANDTTPVPRENVRGTARLRIPVVGLPVLWFQHRQYAPLAAVVVLISIVVLWQPRRPVAR